MNPYISIIVTLKSTERQSRELWRLEDFLESLANQTVRDRIEIIVSDMDSSSHYKAQHEKIAREYREAFHRLEYIYTKTGKPWNISRARNIGIQRTHSEYVMMTDVDCIFAPNFIETVIENAQPDRILHCRVWEMPEGYTGSKTDFKAIRKASILRPTHGYGTCQVVDRKWLMSVRGYDEEYVTWGAEDTDFYYRAIHDDKLNMWIEDKADYFHQWHSQANRAENRELLIRNRSRFELTKSKALPITRNPRGWGNEKDFADDNELDDTCILVTTFLRDECLFRCIASIRKYYPDVAIYVGDNGHPTQEKRNFCQDNNCKYVEVLFDTGVAGTRNEAIQQIPDKYKYLTVVEDDIVFTEGTRLEIWKRILQKDSKIGIAGGLLKRDNGEEQHYEAIHRIEGNVKFADRPALPAWRELKGEGISYYHCDLVLNVFMMRLAMWRGGDKVCKDAIRWDPKFKTVCEHTDFFMSAKYRAVNGHPVRRKKVWGIIYTPDVWAYHIHKAQTQEYARHRRRTAGYEIFGKKWGIDYDISDYNLKNPVAYTHKPKKPLDFNVYDFVLEVAIEILDRNKVKWWLHCGTCLGAIREGNYIKWDSDIDLGIAPMRGKIWEKLTSEFLAKNFSLYKEWSYKDQVLELSFEKYGVKIDLFFLRKKKGTDRLWYGMFGPDKFERWGKFMEFLPSSVPAKLFENLKEIEFRGMRCFVPSPPEKFLTELYGKDWRTPKRNYKYWKDSSAFDNDLLDRVIGVFIFDGWDSIGKKEEQLFRGARKLGNKLIVGILTDSALEGANIPFKHPFDKRIEQLKKLKAIDEIMTINSVAFARDLQKIGYIPNYFIAFKGENSSSIGYLETFGCQIVPVEDVVRMTRKRKPRKKRNNKIAIAIKTFLREDNFFRTVEAIERNVPFPYRLYIADDGRVSDDKQELYEALGARGHKIIRLSHNVGISSGRNAILREVKEDYVLIMDDDIQINDPQIIVNMRRVLDGNDDIGIVAGVLRHEISEKTFGNDSYSRGIDLTIDRGILFRSSTKNPKLEIDGIIYRESDQVINFFLAKTEVFDSVKWDPQIKVEYEHMDFFLELKKTKWKAAICFDAVVTHLHPIPHDMEYAQYRRSAPKDYFYKKHGIGNVINSWATERRLCQIGE